MMVTTEQRTDGDAPPLDTATEQAVAWFARLRAPDVGDDERCRFEAWIAADPAHAAAYRRVADFWGSADFGAAVGRQNRPALFEGVPATSPPRSRRPRRIALYAGAMAAILALVAASPVLTNSAAVALADHRTQTGERRQVALPDGSIATLNTGSAIDVDFADGRRRVTLVAGEAFFDVAADAARPFDVIGGGATARAVGTRFSVRRDGDETAVAVTEGVVAVSGRTDGAAKRLTAGQRVAVRGGAVGAVAGFDAGTALAWRQGRFVFENRPLAEVAAELDRHHPGAIVVAGNALKARRLSGNYRLEDTAEVARAVARAAGAKISAASDYLLIIH